MGGKQLSHELPLLLACFWRAPIKAHETSSLADRNHANRTGIRRAELFPGASTLSNFNIYCAGKFTRIWTPFPKKLFPELLDNTRAFKPA